jgi:hypothetical protein
MTSQSRRRNPLMPWWIGLAIIVAVVAFLAYRFTFLECGAMTGALEFLVLGILPAVYLALMYITFKSQAESER